MKKYIAQLPGFPGFYNSSLDHMIDREFEEEMSEHGDSDRPTKTWEEVDKYANHSAARQAIAEQWVNAFSCGIQLPMKMESMQSPREYNFTTDRVFVELDAKAMKKLWPMRKTKQFKDALKEHFTSRSGFIPFYSNDPTADEWRKPMDEWDHNQIMCLIEAFVLQDQNSLRDFTDDIEECSRVHEAANHLWDKLPEPATTSVN